MPDGDRFERKLRGKGWRNVYRLGCNAAPTEAVVDKIMGAVANVFRTEANQSIRDICTKLEEAINLLESTLFRESVSQNVFDQLSFNVQAVVAEEGYSELPRLGQRAALRTFNEIEGSRQVPSGDVIRQHFTRNLVWELSERRCLSAVRDGIMESTGRDKGSQLIWEAELRKSILEPCAALSKSLLSEDRSRVIRAPKRLFQSKPTTLETLRQPLRTLGDSR